MNSAINLISVRRNFDECTGVRVYSGTVLESNSLGGISACTSNASIDFNTVRLVRESCDPNERTTNKLVSEVRAVQTSDSVSPIRILYTKGD